MPLNKNASAEDFIRDFMDSKADQFKGKSKEEIKKMALAAYYEKQREVKESIKEAILDKLSHLTEEGGKYSHINFKPPESVANAAERGLEYRKKNKGKGGLSAKQASQQGIGSGVQRASDLKSRNNVSPETIKRMVSFFARHAKNKSVEAGKEPWQDKGKIAWELWGGDAGKSWAEKIKNQMDKADEKAKNEVEMRLSNIIKENFEVVESMTSPKHMFKMFKDAEVKAHFYHLQTSSYAEHKALGKFYENLQDITDSIMEISLKDIQTKLNFQCEGGLYIDFTMGFDHCLSRFHTYVELCIASTQDEALKDALIQAERLVSKTKYLLTLR